MFWVYSFLRMPKQCRSYLPAKVWLYWHFSKGHIKKGTLQVGALWVPCVGALMIFGRVPRYFAMGASPSEGEWGSHPGHIFLARFSDNVPKISARFCSSSLEKYEHN